MHRTPSGWKERSLAMGGENAIRLQGKGSSGGSSGGSVPERAARARPGRQRRSPVSNLHSAFPTLGTSSLEPSEPVGK